LIRVERQSLGVPLAEEFVTSWQVDEWLEQARQLMRDPLLGLLRGNLLSPRSGELPTIDPNIPLPPNLVQFGQTLFDALFHGTIYQSWVTAKGIAHNRREVLHLRLGLKGDVLPRLPWEVLHEGNRPLATGADVVFSRYQATYGSMSTVLTPYRSPVVEQNQPLRILMVLAAPTDQEVLELEREANHLREELTHENGSVGKIELTILNQPGREQLTNALERGRFQVLHYAGHSNLGASGGDLYLVSDRTGLTEVLSGDDLAGLLVNNGIRMAVFNSCRGVYAATADPTNITESGNLTEALLRRGVPAVLAMAERIPDDVALTLSRLFYHNLKQHYPIDLSLSRARQGLLSSYGSNQLYWSLPILYLNPDFDGYLLPPLPAETPQAAPVLAGMQAIPPEDVPSRNPIGFDPNPIDLFEESDPLDELDEPEDADREAVLNLLNELRTGSLAEDPNPFVSSSDRFDTTAFDDAEPKTADEYVRQGKWLYQQGDLPGAIAAYGQALQLDSQAADAYSNMGIALEDYDSPAEALIAYKMAVQLNPDLQETQQRLRRLEIAHNMAPNAAQKGIAGSEAKPDMPIPPAQPVTHVVEPAPESRVFAPNLGQAESKRPRVPIMAIAFLATSLLAGLGLWLALSWRPNSPNTFLPSDRQIPAASPPTTQTGILSAQATQSFNEGDVRRGTDAIQQLLDQGNWNAADAAFSAVPSDKLNEPIVSFLRGRVAWEALKRAERTSYSVEDARRYWETAIRGKKDDPMYYNAVGFAFYAESNLGKAGEAWSQAAKLAAQQRESGNKAALQDELTANAGLALATFKSAKAQPANQANLKQDALRLRNRVQRVDPAGFQPDALGKNWLWTEKAIADWRSLLSEK
jgi:tetratricopeptide (TPR) repeat protein